MIRGLTMVNKTEDPQSIYKEYVHFPDDFDSVLMATTSADGVPDVSYAVHLFRDDAYYVYVSELATHTVNLMATARVSLMFIEDESKAQNLFARQRMTLECAASEIERGSDRFEAVLDAFEQHYGNFIQMLRSLNDFHLFRFEPESGIYVRGFGQAYRLQGKGLRQITHIQGKADKNQPE